MGAKSKLTCNKKPSHLGDNPKSTKAQYNDKKITLDSHMIGYTDYLVLEYIPPLLLSALNFRRQCMDGRKKL